MIRIALAIAALLGLWGLFLQINGWMCRIPLLPCLLPADEPVSSGPAGGLPGDRLDLPGRCRGLFGIFGEDCGEWIERMSVRRQVLLEELRNFTGPVLLVLMLGRFRLLLGGSRARSLMAPLASSSSVCPSPV